MTFIATTPEPEAAGAVKAMYDRQRGNGDYLPNYARVFCHRPGVMQAWAALQKEIRSTIDFRTYELVTLVAAQSMRNSYCSLAHGGKLLEGHFTAEQLVDFVSDPDSTVLDDRERAIVALVRKVVADPSSVVEADIEAVRTQGCSDAEIFDIVTAAAARCFFARIPDALGVRPDRVFNSFPEELRKALVVGRAIEDDD